MAGVSACQPWGLLVHSVALTRALEQGTSTMHSPEKPKTPVASFGSLDRGASNTPHQRMDRTTRSEVEILERIQAEGWVLGRGRSPQGPGLRKPGRAARCRQAERAIGRRRTGAGQRGCLRRLREHLNRRSILGNYATCWSSTGKDLQQRSPASVSHHRVLGHHGFRQPESSAGSPARLAAAATCGARALLRLGLRDKPGRRPRRDSA